MNKVRQRFYDEHGIPVVIGCIDCTHVAIVPPKIHDPEFPEQIYVNRKNYHSINVQLVCDADLKIINASAKYPLLRQIHLTGHEDYFLLGDSGYPLRTWLLTVFNEVEPNTPQYNYNTIHKNTRVKTECCNGVLKARFRCLLKDRLLHYLPDIACRIINACVVLHNICVEYNIPATENEDDELDYGIIDHNIGEGEEEEVDGIRRINPELADGGKARMTLVRHLQQGQQN